MLESFLAANKLSVSKILSKKFKRYMTSSKDHEELLHHILKTLANEYYQLRVYENKDDTPITEVEFDIAEFEFRAKELNIHDVTAFYESSIFIGNGYRIGSREDGSRFISKVV
jgi:DNA replication licensing factor MCM2